MIDTDAMYEAISILQCCEDASNEDHVKTAMGIAISMLLTEYKSATRRAEDHES